MAAERQREDERPLDEERLESQPIGDPAEEEDYFVLEEEVESADPAGPVEGDLEEFLFGGGDAEEGQESEFGVDLPGFQEGPGSDSLDPDLKLDADAFEPGWRPSGAQGESIADSSHPELEELELLEDLEEGSPEESARSHGVPVDESLFVGLEEQPEPASSPLLMPLAQEEDAPEESAQPGIAPWLLSEDQLQETPDGLMAAARPNHGPNQEENTPSVSNLFIQPLEEEPEEEPGDEIYGDPGGEEADRPAPTFEELYGLVGPTQVEEGPARAEASDSISVDATSLARTLPVGSNRSRRMWIWGSIAASLVLAAGAGLIFLPELARKLSRGQGTALADLGSRVPTPRPEVPEEVAPPQLGPTAALPVTPRPELPDPAPPGPPAPAQTSPESTPPAVVEPASPEPLAPGPPIVEPARPLEHELGQPKPEPQPAPLSPSPTLVEAPQTPLSPGGAAQEEASPALAGEEILRIDPAGLAWGTQVLAQLRNGNFFVGRVWKVTDQAMELRLKTGEVTFELQEILQVVCLNSDQARRISDHPEGFVLLKNANRIQGQIVVEGAHFVTMEVREARITIPRESIDRVEKGRETSLHLGEEDLLARRLGLTEPLPEPAPDPEAVTSKPAAPVPSGAAAMLEKILNQNKAGDEERTTLVRPAEEGTSGPAGQPEPRTPVRVEQPVPDK